MTDIDTINELRVCQIALCSLSYIGAIASTKQVRVWALGVKMSCSSLLRGADFV